MGDEEFFAGEEGAFVRLEEKGAVSGWADCAAAVRDAVDEEALAEVEVECEGEDKEYAGCEENVEGCFVHVF